MSPFDAGSEHTDREIKDLIIPQGEVSGNEFYDCAFEGCRFPETAFNNCRFVTCQFRRCDLSLLRVTGSSFTETTFQDCNMTGVDWTQASWGLLSAVRFLRCTLNYSIFTNLDLQRASIEGCVAEEVDFRGANLTGVNLRHTDFLGSFFKHTVLERADFSHARNYNIDVNLNQIKGAKFMLPEAVALLRGLDIVLVEGST